MYCYTYSSPVAIYFVICLFVSIEEYRVELKQRRFSELIPDINLILLVFGTCVYLKTPKHLPTNVPCKVTGVWRSKQSAHWSMQASESIKYWIRVLWYSFQQVIHASVYDRSWLYHQPTHSTARCQSYSNSPQWTKPWMSRWTPFFTTFT